MRKDVLLSKPGEKKLQVSFPVMIGEFEKTPISSLPIDPVPSNQQSYSRVGMLVPLKGGIGGIFDPPLGRKNATYIPLIYCLLGGYIWYLPPFRGTRNNH